MHILFPCLTLLLQISLSSLAVDVQPVCDHLESGVDNHISPLDVSQDSTDYIVTCVTPFSVAITAEQADNYLIVEAQSSSQNSEFRTMLLMNKHHQPEILYNTSSKERIINDAYDVNAYIYRKNYHHFTFKPKDLNKGETLYFSIYYLPIEDSTQLESITFSVKASFSSVYPCPQDCGQFGKCDPKLEKCVCNRGSFDEDCTVQAIEISETDDYVGRDTPLQDFQLFFYEITNVANDLKVVFKKSEGQIDLSYSLNKQNNFNLPNYDGRMIITSLDTPAKQSYIAVPHQTLFYHNGDTLLIAASNVKTTDDIVLQVKIESYEDPEPNRTTLMSILLGVSAFLVISWGVLTVFKFKSYREEEALLQARNQSATEQRDNLTKEDLDRYFKKKKFKDAKSSFSQNQCSICLDDFQPETVCRQLYCEHLFHSTCIESWLSQHNTCPNCKKEMTKSAIEDYLSSPKLLDEVKAEEEMERNNPRADESSAIKISLPHPRGATTFEEQKEDRGRSLNDIVIQTKDNRSVKGMGESLNTLNMAERKGSSLRNTPKYLEPKQGFPSRRKEEGLYRKNTQDATIDLEERDVREKEDMASSIGLRLDQKKSRNVSEINPLKRRQISEKYNEDSEL